MTNTANSAERTPAIVVEGVGKDFRVRAEERGWGLVGGSLGARRTLRALDGVSLEVARGEMVGVVGLNGSGKSTLLKIVAGITPASRGTVRVAGRVGSLLEVGAGFHPELSGYENVYLNGSLLGLSRDEVDRRMPGIVEFAGLEGFMHAPVKHYSSGMAVRLGFAVAAFTEPEVLLLDETFSVGDATFQARALRSVLQRRDAGTAILLVSHDVVAVREHCSRALWLHEGRPRALGPADEVVDAYWASIVAMNERQFASDPRVPRAEERAAAPFVRQDAPLELTGAVVESEPPRPASPADSGEPGLPRIARPERLTLTVGWRQTRANCAAAQGTPARLTVALLRRSDDLVVWRSEAMLAEILRQGPAPAGPLPARGAVRMTLPMPPLYSDTFRFVATLGHAGEPGRPWSRAVAEFEVVGLRSKATGPYPFLTDPCTVIEHRPLASSDGTPT